jgi:hypothetical protein
MALTRAELLMHTTVRLEVLKRDGSVTTGTGFFFAYPVDDKQHIPVIVTNRHVVEDGVKGTFVLTKASETGEPILGSSERVEIGNLDGLAMKHVDKDVDLAVIPMAALYRQAEQSKIRVFAPPFEPSLIPTPEQMENLGGIETITMVGYPNGIWDQENNLPIVRRGITATNPKYDYNGLPIFVIDCACFPGSSGSPVLIFDQGSYTDAKGNIYMGGGRLLLLGVLFAGPQHEAPGEIRTIEVPLAQVSIALSRIPNNLGFVVHARKLNDFRSVLMSKA